MRSRDTYLYFQIDTNRINCRRSLANMNRLEKWRHESVIGLVMSDIAHSEAMAGRDFRRSRKAARYIYSLSFERQPRAREMQARIATVLFPGGCRSQNDMNDVCIVYNAWRYQHILVTGDGAILGKSEELENLGVKVMNDAEAVVLVEEHI